MPVISSHFFIASDEELDGLNEVNTPMKSLPGVPGKLVSSPQLNLLHDIVEGHWPLHKIDTFAAGRVARVPGDKCAVLSLCSTMVAGLAQADDEQLEEFTNRWEQADNWGDAGITHGDIAAMVEGMAELGRRLYMTGRSMHVWATWA
jgi:hypothetical protein